MPPQSQPVTPSSQQSERRFGRFAVFAAIALLCAIAAGAAAFFWYLRSEEDAARFFAQALAEHNVVESVSINGVRFEVNRGAVVEGGSLVEGRAALPALRLAYALAAARRTPVFGLEGVEPARLARTATKLEALQGEIAALTDNSYPEWTGAIRENLFPVAFLKAVAELEAARQTFLASGTPEDEAAYERLFPGVLAAHREAAARYLEAGERLSQVADAEPPIAGLEMWLGALRRLETASGDIEEFVLEPRRRCVSRRVGACEPERDIALPDVPPIPTVLEAATPEQLTRVGRVREALVSGTGAEPQGPVYQLTQSYCAPVPEEPHFFVWRTDEDEDGAVSRALIYVTDLFLPKVSEMSTSTEASEYLRENGVSLYPLWLTTHYACRGVASDIARTAFTEEVAATARNAPFSAYVPAAQKAPLEALEAALSSEAAVLREADALAYLGEARQALASAHNTPAPALHKLSSLLLMYHARTAGFNDYAGQIASIGERNLSIYSRAPALVASIFKPPFLFTFKSGSAWLLLRQSPNVVGEEPAAAAGGTPTIPAPLPNRDSYVLFSELPTDGYTVETLINDLRFIASITRAAAASE